MSRRYSIKAPPGRDHLDHPVVLLSRLRESFAVVNDIQDAPRQIFDHPTT